MVNAHQVWIDVAIHHSADTEWAFVDALIIWHYYAEALDVHTSLQLLRLSMMELYQKSLKSVNSNVT